MDDLTVKGSVVDQTLQELDLINAWLGGNQITLRIVKKEIQANMQVVDVGCGSGRMLQKVHAWCRKRNIPVELTGIDANPHIIKYARKNQSSDIHFETTNIFDLSFSSRRFDIILATLFLHHFAHDSLVTLLAQWKQQASVIIINDLHRHPLAYYSIKWLTRLFSKSSMVRYDAPLSVARGFKRKEWEHILGEAGITNYQLRWRWAFRWELVIRN